MLSKKDLIAKSMERDCNDEVYMNKDTPSYRLFNATNELASILNDVDSLVAEWKAMLKRC